MITVEQCVEHVDDLVQQVMNAWGINLKAGNAKYMTEEFKEICELASQYRNANQIADNHREFNVLSAEDAARETATRDAFAKAYKKLSDKHNLD